MMAYLTVRLIMQGMKVGSYREEKGNHRDFVKSGVKINILDGSCPECIVTVTGPADAIFKTFTFICMKFEEFKKMQNGWWCTIIDRL